MENEIYSKKKQVTFSQFRNEIAFHEASHFVFNVITLKHFNKQLVINYAICCPERINEEKIIDGKVEDYNVVNVKASKSEDWYGFHDYFRKDRRKLVASLLVAIAGYSSYQLFVENSEFYIFSEVEFDTPNKGCCTIKYCSLTGYRYCRTCDFGMIQERLESYYRYDYSDRMKAIEILTNVVQDLMRRPEVKASIELVKEKLLKNECQKIQGTELNILVEKVEKLTTQIQIDDILERLKDKIQ